MAETFDPLLVRRLLAGDPDQHAIVFHPHYDGKANQVMYVANDGGIFQTTNARAAVAGPAAVCDPGGSAVRWHERNVGYVTTQFHHGVAYPDLSRYLGGTQDNGTLAGGGGDPPAPWEELLDEDGGSVAVDPRDPQVLYADRVWRRTVVDLRRSDDGGTSWARKVTGISDPYYVFHPFARFAMDPEAPDRLLLGSGFGHLWVTEDRAESWRLRANPRSTARHPESGERLSLPVTALAIRGGSWIAALGHDVVTNGTVVRLSNWDYRSEGDLRSEVSSVAIHPTDPNRFYATSSRVEELMNLPHAPAFRVDHVWTSSDGGKTWRSIDGSPAGRLPDVGAYSIVADPRQPGRLFVGTEQGIYSSENEGQTWTREPGVPNVRTVALSLVERPEGRYLIAFTHGRGAWKGRLAD